MRPFAAVEGNDLPSGSGISQTTQPKPLTTIYFAPSYLVAQDIPAIHTNRR